MAPSVVPVVIGSSRVLLFCVCEKCSNVTCVRVLDLVPGGQGNLRLTSVCVRALSMCARNTEKQLQNLQDYHRTFLFPQSVTDVVASAQTGHGFFFFFFCDRPCH